MLGNMKRKVVILLCAACLVLVASENWKPLKQEATWEFQLVRRAIDTDITMATLEADTLITCSHSCSSLMDIECLSLYFLPKTKICYCNMVEDTNPENVSVAEICYGTLKELRKKQQNDEQLIINTEWPYKKDCLSLYNSAYREDGAYTIDPRGGVPTDTWCDMTNGGWTVIQRRTDGSENFYRGWSDYVNGFGNATGEFWLGLENIYRLTQGGSHLEINLEYFPGVTPQSFTANYTSFVVGDSASNYTLHVAGFTGDSCGDSFQYHDGYAFTTYDYDNDIDRTNCAKTYRGAWWYNACHRVNLNGYYYQPGEYSYKDTWATGIHWYKCKKFTRSAKTSEMKIRLP